jgi:hypothetical protein
MAADIIVDQSSVPVTTQWSTFCKWHYLNLGFELLYLANSASIAATTALISADRTFRTNHFFCFEHFLQKVRVERFDRF